MMYVILLTLFSYVMLLTLFLIVIAYLLLLIIISGREESCNAVWILTRTKQKTLYIRWNLPSRTLFQKANFVGLIAYINKSIGSWQLQRSPQIGLAHELTHAFDADEGLLEPVSVEIPGVKGVPINELKAIKMENKIRKKFNEKKRNTYKETIIPENILGE